MAALYDTIGKGYSRLRKPDPAIEKAIHQALGEAKTLVNVGAGAGSYEPTDRSVLAVELSRTMLDQRARASAPVIQASAMALPFADGAFDASLAILTIHHWTDPDQGLSELRRVAGDRVVIMTWDPEFPGFWLADYIPELLEIDRPIFPTLDRFRRHLGTIEVRPVPIPHDCTDGFMCAYWRRPEAYLDPGVRSAISTFFKLGDLTAELDRLRRDLASGDWHRRYGHLQGLTELDLGYRLVTARLRS